MKIEDIETPAHVRKAVEYLRSIAGDDEAAHSYEDELRARVLHLVAAGEPDARLMAIEVLETENIDFSRWCA